MRGIIVGPKVRKTGPRAIEVVGGVDPVGLRRAALYWDQIARAQSRIFSIGLQPDEVELKSANVLTEHYAPIRQVETEQAIYETPSRVFAVLNAQEAGQWSLAVSSPDQPLPSDLGVQRRVIEVELYQALPVPAADVPIHDILQFRSKRKDELGAFRLSMDALYQKVLASPDGARAMDSAITEVKRSLDNIHRVLDETRMSRAVSSLKASVSVHDTKGLMALAHHPLAFALGLASAAASSIKITTAIAAAFKDPIRGLGDYAYVGYSVRDLASERPSLRLDEATPQRPRRGVQIQSVGVSNAPRTEPGRNDPCYCHSGRKYKKCHGLPASLRPPL
jgi:hypothetical protein